MDDKMIEPLVVPAPIIPCKKKKVPFPDHPIPEEVQRFCAGLQVTYYGVYQDQDAYAISFQRREGEPAPCTGYPAYLLVARDGSGQARQVSDSDFAITSALMKQYQATHPPKRQRKPVRPKWLISDELEPQDLMGYDFVVIRSMHWKQDHHQGQWLDNFALLLVNLGVKEDERLSPTLRAQLHREALPAMLDAAAYFTVQYAELDDEEIDDTDEDMYSEREARQWSKQISFVAKAKLSTSALAEFRHYLSHGRKSVMTFD